MTKLSKLETTLESLTAPSDINLILDELNIEYSNVNARNLISAIRFAGFTVKSVSSWSKDQGKSIRQSIVYPS